MRKNIIKISGILAVGLLLSSCGPKKDVPLVYFPDMYYPVAYDPLMQAKDPYMNHDNEVPVFASRDGETGMEPVVGTVPQNKDGVLPSETPVGTDEYNKMYEASKGITSSPLNPANREADIARGKVLFDHTCSACHGTEGDGQGPIVQSGAYSGVPAYKDRDITVGSVHFVLENGRNNMGSYAGQLMPGDRWRVAMYVMDAFKKAAPAAAPAPAAAAAAKSPAAPATSPAVNTKK